MRCSGGGSPPQSNSGPGCRSARRRSPIRADAPVPAYDALDHVMEPAQRDRLRHDDPAPDRGFIRPSSMRSCSRRPVLRFGAGGRRCSCRNGFEKVRWQGLRFQGRSSSIWLIGLLRRSAWSTLLLWKPGQAIQAWPEPVGLLSPTARSAAGVRSTAREVLHSQGDRFRSARSAAYLCVPCRARLVDGAIDQLARRKLGAVRR